MTTEKDSSYHGWSCEGCMNHNVLHTPDPHKRTYFLRCIHCDEVHLVAKRSNGKWRKAQKIDKAVIGRL
jgi:hypothetical protein